ncbi:dTDP-glucose 4,6-dehydratase [bacterium]|nr:dTDP-glucose 4,6-dehydratase [bacterium]
MKLLVTGGCGFIGSAYLRLFVPQRPHNHYTNLDLLTYAGNPKNVASVSALPNYDFIHGDIRDNELVSNLASSADGIIHFAAETHVDRSIESSSAFVTTNVVGTHHIVEAARHCEIPLLVVSTDEVYGSLDEDDPPTSESSPLKGSSPYAAAKAGGDLLALASHRTFGTQVCITRCANNYGPYQYPEKLIPVLVRQALDGKPLTLYGDGRNLRDWLHVDDHARAIDTVFSGGKSGEVYNIGGVPRRNIEIAKEVLIACNQPPDQLALISDRPGHDWRYAVDDRKIRSELNWKPLISFEEGMGETIQWYQSHESWWRPLLGEAGGRRGLLN